MIKPNDGRIRILFHNHQKDGGVYYYRTFTPAIELEQQANNDFYVEINSDIDFNDPNSVEYLKTFDIIHYHYQLVKDTQRMIRLKNELSKHNVLFVMDIDDYWVLEKNHPNYYLTVQSNIKETVLFNLSLADYVTTTTELLANEIKKITKKDNVLVLHNSINPEWMHQFKNNWKPDPNGLVRITYMGGSSHKNDVNLLGNTMNLLRTDKDLKNKFKIILAGWDVGGSTTDIRFNEEFSKELIERKLWTKDVIRSINSSMGNVDLIKGLPNDIKEKYRNNVFIRSRRDIESQESAYFYYEKVLTDNHKLIEDKNYLQWLMTFDKNNYYEDEGVFGRRWTKKTNNYATTLDETDIVIAPLEDTKFNIMKSNLKQVECWSRKLPVVCSDIPPYNVDGIHMRNTVLIPNKKNAQKYWKRELKKLILSSELREEIGTGLYLDFSEKYNLINVTNKRIEFYKKINKC